VKPRIDTDSKLVYKELTAKMTEVCFCSIIEIMILSVLICGKVFKNGMGCFATVKNEYSK